MFDNTKARHLEHKPLLLLRTGAALTMSKTPFAIRWWLLFAVELSVGIVFLQISSGGDM